MHTDIIVSDNQKSGRNFSRPHVFNSFQEATALGYRSRTGWEQSCRHVPSQPVTAVIDLGRNQGYVNVYLYDQTQPFTDRRAAQQRYLELFFSHARKEQYALWIDKGWTTINATDCRWDRLTKDKVLRHANHRDSYALQCQGKTWFVVVDLDCHEKDDVDLFLRRAETLLERFHGDGWHYQRKRTPAP